MKMNKYANVEKIRGVRKNTPVNNEEIVAIS
jgi:hypothetical protein